MAKGSRLSGSRSFHSVANISSPLHSSDTVDDRLHESRNEHLLTTLIPFERIRRKRIVTNSGYTKLQDANAGLHLSRAVAVSISCSFLGALIWPGFEMLADLRFKGLIEHGLHRLAKLSVFAKKGDVKAFCLR